MPGALTVDLCRGTTDLQLGACMLVNTPGWSPVPCTIYVPGRNRLVQEATISVQSAPGKLPFAFAFGMSSLCKTQTNPRSSGTARSDNRAVPSTAQ
eukprot:347513-Rhodomonas_salina.1